MRRRGFLQLAGAAVLGVLATKVPVFVEELPIYPLAPRGMAHLVGSTGPEFVSMYIYPTYYALPVKITGVLGDRTIRTLTVDRVPDNVDSTWVAGPAKESAHAA